MATQLECNVPLHQECGGQMMQEPPFQTALVHEADEKTCYRH